MKIESPRLVSEDSGATGVEYAILASLVAAVIIGTVVILSDQVLALFNLVVGGF